MFVDIKDYFCFDLGRTFLFSGKPVDSNEIKDVLVKTLSGDYDYIKKDTDIYIAINMLFACYRILVWEEKLSEQEAMDAGLRISPSIKESAQKAFNSYLTTIPKNTFHIEIIFDDGKYKEMLSCPTYSVDYLLMYYLLLCIIFGKEYLVKENYTLGTCENCHRAFYYQKKRKPKIWCEECINRSSRRTLQRKKAELRKKAEEETANGKHQEANQ